MHLCLLIAWLIHDPWNCQVNCECPTMNNLFCMQNCTDFQLMCNYFITVCHLWMTSLFYTTCIVIIYYWNNFQTRSILKIRKDNCLQNCCDLWYTSHACWMHIYTSSKSQDMTAMSWLNWTHDLWVVLRPTRRYTIAAIVLRVHALIAVRT